MNFATKEDVTRHIIERVTDYLESPKKNESPGTLYSSTTISRTTIKRYVKGDSEVMTGHVAFRLLSHFYKKSEVLEIMKPSYSKWLNDNGNKLLDEKPVELDTDKPKSFIRSFHDKIFSLAHLDGGISRKDLIQKYGEDIGIKFADELVERGMLIYSNGCYIVKGESLDISDPNIYMGVLTKPQ